MSLVKRGTVFHFDFWYRGIRYQGSTDQKDRADAQLVEDRLKERLRWETHGLLRAHPEAAPFIQEFANVYLVHQSRRLTNVAVLVRTLRMVLGFWGKAPRQHPIAGAPYHHLRLSDPVIDPRWLDRFEQYMDARKLSGSTKNSYLSAMSGIYKLAARPRYRARTGIDRNPFADIGRHPTRKRHVTTSPEDIRRWMQHAAPHLRLAIAIGGLAHKLRVAQVLALRFDQHLDPDLTRITFDQHKTIRHTRRAQVTHVSPDLRRVLEAVREARPGATYVVTWRGQPIKSLTTAARQAAARAGLPYGLQDGGLTFHALRHVGATELARMGVSAALAAKAGGHLDPRTTEQHYTHLIDRDEQAIVDQLSDRLGLADAALAPVGDAAGTQGSTPRRIIGKRRARRRGQSDDESGVIH